MGTTQVAILESRSIPFALSVAPKRIYTNQLAVDIAIWHHFELPSCNDLVHFAPCPAPSIEAIMKSALDEGALSLSSFL